MSLENVKSLLLIVLIAISIFLTFGLWTYQPSDEVLDAPVAEEVSLEGTDNTIAEVIAPANIIFNGSGGYYGFSNSINQENFYTNISTWTFDGLRIVQTSQPPTDYDVEIVFPDALPMGILTYLFQFNEEDISLPSWSFDRMLITRLPQTEELQIQFPSIDGRQQAVTTVSSAAAYQRIDEYMDQAGTDLMREYVRFDEGERRMFLPETDLTLPGQTITITETNPQTFVEILFNDPSIVNQTSSYPSEASYYTDGQRGMEVFHNSGRIQYINPYTANESEDLTSLELLNRSLRDINDHDGWTADYYLADANESDNQITYQMHHQGYPVFNEDNNTFIQQVWENNQMIGYNRPLFQLDTALSGNSKELPPGSEVIAYLTDSASFNLDNVQDIRLGYRLNYMDNAKYIDLIPSWFVNYGGDWLDLGEYMNGEGGN